MKTIGFLKSDKENENRIALIPKDIVQIKNKSSVYIENGYGSMLGYSDSDYAREGVNIVSREEAMNKDIICDPKIGDAEYINKLRNQIIFGWIHAVQNRNITDTIINNNLTAIAWEDMYEYGRHIFWKNNEIAGEAAVSHAITQWGRHPIDAKVAVIGRGNTAVGALRMLHCLGADVEIFGRHTEHILRKDINKYDIVVNAVLWDTTRKDHIISKSDISSMKKGALIIDVSCDRAGAIETSIPTTIDDPIYYVDGIMHYVVDHTPSIFYKSISKTLSEVVAIYIDKIIEDNLDEVLLNALVIKDGEIIDNRINKFQNRI